MRRISASSRRRIFSPPLAPEYPRGSIFLAVVDPGVGGRRDAIVVRADGRTFVGPDNGLLSVLRQRALSKKMFSHRVEAETPLERVSRALTCLRRPLQRWRSGRARRGRWIAAKRSPRCCSRPGRSLPQVIYVDHYGNCMTGIRAGNSLAQQRDCSSARGACATWRTFGDARGPFWYENSLGTRRDLRRRAEAQGVVGFTRWQRDSHWAVAVAGCARRFRANVPVELCHRPLAKGITSLVMSSNDIIH